MQSPYRSAQRITTTARNVLVRVVLEDGTKGFGEAAPAAYVTGETQESVMARLQSVAPELAGGNFFDAFQTMAKINEPGARGALEMALRDALARARGMSLFTLLTDGTNAPKGQQTDLSLPLLPPNEAELRAAQATSDGYRAIKIKIGGPDINEDEARVRAIAQNAPQAKLRLDGNQGFTSENAVRFMERLSDLLPRIELLEQPTKAGDDDALLWVQQRVPVPVFADEAVHSPTDATRLVTMNACKGVVLKLAKSGIKQTDEIANATVKAGGQLMFGCMMETRLAISAALQLSGAIGKQTGVQPLLDLDGHLLTKADGMVSGGFTQEGDVLTFDPQTPGLGVDVVWPPV